MSLKDFVRHALEMQRNDLLRSLHGLTPEDLAWRPAEQGNAIGFLAWHMARVEDMWVQRVFQGKQQLWQSDGWSGRLGMEAYARDNGFGFDEAKLAAFRPPALPLLLAYMDAVRQKTLAFLDGWDANGAPVQAVLPWDKGVTLGIERFWAQILWELNQHSGQAAYVRGLRRALVDAKYMGPVLTPGA